ncbi:Dipeptidyl-peptidase 5, partial [Coemansia guatemalensis]
MWAISHIIILYAATLLRGTSGENGNGIGSHVNNTQPLTVELFHSLHRIGAPAVSPDGTRVLFTQVHYIEEVNKSATFISMVDIASGETVQITEDRAGLSFNNPMWFDDATIGYMHNGTLYQSPLDGEASAVFTPPVDISSVAFRAPSLLTFIASVHPNSTLAESRELKRAAANRRDSAQVYTNLWVRHWDKWMTLEKPTLFAVQIDRKEDGWAVGTETDLLQNMPLCEDPLVRWSVEDYTVDLQGEHVAFVVRRPGHDMAWSTDVDIYLTPTSASQPQLLT